tara:strand:- start:755 stop:1009 length:255 start_codon:yes stop_codon:yes gene_type:complete
MNEEDCINIIIRQTNYNQDEAKQKLIDHNNDYLEVIKKYINSDSDSDKTNSNIKNTTNNQLIYKEFRNIMDSASKNYRIHKENS